MCTNSRRYNGIKNNKSKNLPKTPEKRREEKKEKKRKERKEKGKEKENIFHHLNVLMKVY